MFTLQDKFPFPEFVLVRIFRVGAEHSNSPSKSSYLVWTRTKKKKNLNTGTFYTVLSLFMYGLWRICKARKIVSKLDVEKGYPWLLKTSNLDWDEVRIPLMLAFLKFFCIALKTTFAIKVDCIWIYPGNRKCYAKIIYYSEILVFNSFMTEVPII